MTDDRPQPPAAAYRVMERIIDPSWFLRPAPEQGVALTIVGTDGVQTLWYFGYQQAAAIRETLGKIPTQARIIRAEDYDDGKRRGEAA